MARRLDLDVAVRIMGYRWVEWNHALLHGAPLDQPGRFLARPDDPLAHLQTPARPGTPDQEGALGALPRFSRDLQLALEAAKAVGLFRDGDADLSRGTDGDWALEVRAGGRRYAGPSAAAVVCRAALDWLSRAHRDRGGRGAAGNE